MKLSIVFPIYNEIKTIRDVLELIQGLKIDKEIILVDDFSVDGTREFLKKNFNNGRENIRVFYHDENLGKGVAIRTALLHASGDYIIVQDADLEYSPLDIIHLADYADKTKAIAVYGSRFLKTWRSTTPAHFVINKFLTMLTNALYGGKLTDMETCYKMIRTDIMRSLDIRAERFEFEPEVTVKLLKKGYEIKELPISYRGRGYDEGKKITWKDGLEALWVLVKMKLYPE